MTAASAEKIQEILHHIDQWPVDNASAVVLHDGQQVASYGDTDHVFPLASVSKLLTAYAVLVAAEEGAFGLDDRIPNALAEHFDTPPTIRQLLAHGSGVAFDSRSPERAPESRRIYSSAGYEMLADTVGELTTIAFPEYAVEALNQPLGMKVTYEGSAGHGFSASVNDLALFAREILEPRLLPEQSLAEALTVQFPGLDGIVPGYGRQKPCPWGLGFEIHGVNNDIKSPHWLGETMPAHLAGHFGQSGTFFWVDRYTGTAAIVLTDREFGQWAKQRWSTFNDALWDALHQE